MHEANAPTPEALARSIQDLIREASGMEADFSLESLAAVDYFVSELPPRPPEALSELITQIGCYFGEVLRRALPAQWELAQGTPPTTWKLTFEAFSLSIFPVGMAAEAVFRDETGGYDGSLHVPPESLARLEQVLDAMSEVSEEYYYSLTGRLETIQHVLDVLVAGRRVN